MNRKRFKRNKSLLKVPEHIKEHILPVSGTIAHCSRPYNNANLQELEKMDVVITAAKTMDALYEKGCDHQMMSNVIAQMRKNLDETQPKHAACRAQDEGFLDEAGGVEGEMVGTLRTLIENLNYFGNQHTQWMAFYEIRDELAGDHLRPDLLHALAETAVATYYADPIRAECWNHAIAQAVEKSGLGGDVGE